MMFASRFRTSLLCIALAAPVPAIAAPITYAISGVGSGTLGATSFTNAAYQICIAADTTEIQGSGGTLLVVAPTTITITNLGSAVVTEQVGFVVAQPSSQAAFYRVSNGGDLLTMVNPAFQTFALATALGPLTDLTASNLGQFTNLQTSLGAMALPSSGTVTFQATLGPCPSLVGPPSPTAAAPVPATQPAALALIALLTSIAGIAALRRRMSGRGRPG